MQHESSGGSMTLGALARRSLSIPLLAVVLASCGGGKHATGTPAIDGQGRFRMADTGQMTCYDTRAEISPPASGQPFYGQDAQCAGTQPSYAKSSDGLSVYDNVTGLTWQKRPDTNEDGAIDSLDKMTFAEAQARPAALNASRYGGYDDWRLPTIKELYSLINFAGIDPGGETGTDTSGLTPFIDRAFFDFGYGDTERGERIIDMQYASSTRYVSTTMLGSPTMFGVSFADGRIKGYTLDMSYQGPGNARFPVRCVRGAEHGTNDFVDNGDGTITDRATGLMWARTDSDSGMDWQHALAYAQVQNASRYLGHGDWRLPNTKELQSIVDYTRSPVATTAAKVGPAIDPMFTCTPITNEAGAADYPYHWTSTSAIAQAGGTYAFAWYVAFGRAVGADGKDLQGAGAVRFDAKVPGQPGGESRYYNFVRLVRDAE
jgi:hypothetical protein